MATVVFHAVYKSLGFLTYLLHTPELYSVTEKLYILSSFIEVSETTCTSEWNKYSFMKHNTIYIAHGVSMKHNQMKLKQS